MEDCIFCKIVKGEIDSAKIWEDDEFLAILDVNPNTKGATLVLTKNHYPADFFNLPEEICKNFILATRKVVEILKKGLDVKRVAMIMEGMGINHAHIKLYPLHGLEKEFEEIWASEKIFFEKYEGYLTSQLGPQADFGELKELAEKIRKQQMV